MTINTEQATQLLQQLADTRRRALDEQPADHRFNLFRLLRPAHDEVRLHSRFLAELLNPAGSHGQGNLFLILFAKQLRVDGFAFPDYFNLNRVTVRREHRRIDLLLDDGEYWIVIENKIYALDQPAQLFRYYDEAVKHHRTPVLYYLTLDGHSPADHSIQGLPAEAPLHLLSYADSISDWLTSCAHATNSQPKLHHTILQYQQLLWQLIGQTMSDEKDAVLRLMTQPDYAVQAATLVRNWRHVRHDVEYQFWVALEKLVAASYRVDDDAHFSGDTIHKAINSRNSARGYGIKFELGTLRQHPVLFKIDRGHPILTYGLPAKSLVAASATDEEMATLRLAFPHTESSFWLAYQHTSNSLDFDTFSNEATLRLANPAARILAVDALWTEVTIFAGACASRIQRVFGESFVAHLAGVSNDEPIQ